MSQNTRPERVSARSERSSQPLRGQDVGGAKDGWTSSLDRDVALDKQPPTVAVVFGGLSPVAP